MFILISGVSGSGKSTLINFALSVNSILQVPISVTTRKMRSLTEKNNYIFVDNFHFQQYTESNSLLEFQKYKNNYYGILKDSYLKIIQDNKIAIRDIGLQGIISIKKEIKNSPNIFIDVPIDLIYQRLLERNEDTKVIKERLKDISNESNQLRKIADYIFLNDSTLEEAQNKFITLIKNLT